MNIRIQTQLLLLAGFLLLGLQPLAAQENDKGMKFFHGTWEEVMAEAKKQNKPVIVDCYTTWCGPCKRMASGVFTQEKVGEYYNTNYINYKLDMEKGEGPGIARKYQVRFYPTFLFFSPEGELVHKALGGRSPVDFVEEGKKALNPETAVYSQIERFKQGERDPAFLKKLIVLTNQIDPEVQKQAVQAYWEALPPEKILEEEHWEMFKQTGMGIRAPHYQYLLKNREKFLEKYAELDVYKKLYEEAGISINTAVETKDDTLFNEAAAILRTSDNKEILSYADRAELTYLKQMGRWKEFEKKAEAFAKGHAKDNARDLHQIAYETYTGTDNKKLLKKAEKWVLQSIAIEQNFFNTDTYAQILYKLGKTEEAEQNARKALEYARQIGADASRTQALLNTIEREKKDKTE